MHANLEGRRRGGQVRDRGSSMEDSEGQSYN